MTSLQSVFSQFDLDGSGYIDVSQIKDIAKKLGESINEKEIKELISVIDTNNDGKISFKEFKQWWTKGHKGKLHDLIVMKFKSLKQYEALKEVAKTYGVSLQDYKPTVQKDSLSVTATIGENDIQNQNQRTSIKIGYVCGVNEIQEFQNKKGFQNSFLNEKTLSLTIKLPSDQPKKLKTVLQSLIAKFFEAFGFRMGILVKLENIESNDYLNIKMEARQKQKHLIVLIEPGKLVNQLFDQIIQLKQDFISKMTSDFGASLQIQLSLNQSLKSMLGGNKTLLQTLLQGCHVSIKANMTTTAFKLLRKFIFKSSSGRGFEPFLLLKNVKMNLNIRSTEQLDQFFKKLGVLEIVKDVPSLRDIIEMIIPQVETMKKKSQAGESQNGLQFFDIYQEILKVFVTYVNTGTTVILSKGNYALYVIVQGEGLKELYDLLFSE